MNDLIKGFERIVTGKSNEETNLIKNGSVVALKHVTTGKYLSSIENLLYTTGSKDQLVCFHIVAFILLNIFIELICLFTFRFLREVQNLIQILYGKLILIKN